MGFKAALSKINPWLIGLSACTFLAESPDHYRDQSTLMLFGLSVLIAFQMMRKVHWSSAALFLWCVLRGLMVFSVKHSPYEYNGLETSVSFDVVSAKATVSVLIVSWAALELKESFFQKIANAFSWLAVINALVMLFNTDCGILDNAAMDASLTLTLIPLMLFRKEFKWKWLVAIPLAAIIKSGSSTAFIGLFALAAAYWYAFQGRKLQKLAELFLFDILIWALNFVLWFGTDWVDLIRLPFLHHALFYSDGRSTMWKCAWKFFVQSNAAPGYGLETKVLHQSMGFGTGTYAIHGPLLYPDQLFIWLHNDWLQLGFEQGAVGLLLASIIFFLAWKRTRSNPWLFPAIFSYGFTMLTQMPLRHVFSAFYGAFLIRLAFERKELHGS